MREGNTSFAKAAYVMSHPAEFPHKSHPKQPQTQSKTTPASLPSPILLQQPKPLRCFNKLLHIHLILIHQHIFLKPRSRTIAIELIPLIIISRTLRKNLHNHKKIRHRICPSLIKNRFPRDQHHIRQIPPVRAKHLAVNHRLLPSTSLQMLRPHGRNPPPTNQSFPLKHPVSIRQIRWIYPVQFPSLGIVLNILTNTLQRFFVTDYEIVVPSLPQFNPPCALHRIETADCHRFKILNNCADGTGLCSFLAFWVGANVGFWLCIVVGFWFWSVGMLQGRSIWSGIGGAVRRVTAKCFDPTGGIGDRDDAVHRVGHYDKIIQADA